MIFKLFFQLEVEGRENVPKKGGFILAGNHISYLDPIAVGVATPRGLSYLARDDLFLNPLFAWLLYSVRAFPVKRDSADISALKESLQRVRNGGGLVIFPEGSRKADRIFEPEPGIGFLASKLNTPVVPVFVKGTEIALPKGAKFLKPAKISVHFGKQILIERGMPYQDIARLVMEKIRRLVC